MKSTVNEFVQVNDVLEITLKEEQTRTMRKSTGSFSPVKQSSPIATNRRKSFGVLDELPNTSFRTKVLS